MTTQARIFIALICCITQAAYGFIYRIDEYYNPDTNRSIYCLNLVHHDPRRPQEIPHSEQILAMHLEQRKDLSNVLRSKSISSKPLLIAEDMYAVEESHPMIRRLLASIRDQAYRLEMCPRLVELTRYQGITAETLMTTMKIASSSKESGIKAQEVYSDVKKNLEEISKYKGSPVFEDYCRKGFGAYIQTNRHILEKMRSSEGTLRDILSSEKDIVSLQNFLFDARILSIIEKYPDHKEIFIVAGGGHIHAIAPVLNALNFKLIRSTGEVIIPTIADKVAAITAPATARIVRDFFP